MKLENPWVGYLNRSYRQIKASLINRLITKVPEITDYAETNILVIIITMFAGLVEQLHYYIDNWARESYLSTCRLFSSAVKLTRILDYRVKASLPSSVDLYITYLDNEGNPVVITEDGLVPVGTSIKTQNGINFITTKNVTIKVGSSFGVLPAKQQEKVDSDVLGTTSNTMNQVYDLPTDYAHNTLEITINGEVWTRQLTLARSLPTDKDFIVDVATDGIPYVKFGNGVKGQIPDANFDIVASYYTTDGKSGNDISAFTITQLDVVLVLPSPAVSVRITNNLSPVGGYNIETVDDIRNNAPLSIRTLSRAVTAPDYTDMALLADSVVKALAINTCGKNVQIYIAPAGGGLATQSLLDDTQEYMETVKMITTKLNVRAAGITPVYASLLITPKFRADKIQCKIDAQNALSDKFSFDNQAINGRVAYSDLVALIDNLDRVDTVELQALYTLPYAFPRSAGTIALDWTRSTGPGSTEKNNWRLVYTGTDIRVYKNGANIGNTAINVVFTDNKNIITFVVNDGMYSVGDYWEFTTYPFLATIKTDDNTIPIIIGTLADITVL